MGKIINTDTSDFCSFDIDDKIYINHKEYIVTGHAREARFGLEDPKLWVKKVIETETGERKIIKLVFLEEFDMTLGGTKIKCFRDPVKEGDILDLVTDHPYFMQGESFDDKMGNCIRVIDIVHGNINVDMIHILRKPTAGEELMGKEFMNKQPEIREAVLQNAKDKLTKSGYDPDKIETRLISEQYQTIGDGIIDQFEKGDYNMVVIGRKKMSKAEEFVLGDPSVKLVRTLGKAAVIVVKS